MLDKKSFQGFPESEQFLCTVFISNCKGLGWEKGEWQKSFSTLFFKSAINLEPEKFTSVLK